MAETALLKAGWINTTIITGLSILLVSLLVRLTKKDSLSVMGVELPVRWVPLLMIPFTVAHGYFGIGFNLWVRRVIVQSPESSPQVFETLTERGPLFFNGLVSRLEFVQGPAGPVFMMDFRDPTTWLAHGAALAAFLILVRWRGLTWFRKVGSVLFAAVIVVTNWLIGGGWAVHASCLQRPQMCHILLQIA